MALLQALQWPVGNESVNATTLSSVPVTSQEKGNRMKELHKRVEVYLYSISGYYYAEGKRKHFDKEVYATDNTEAMKNVLGELVWKESLNGNEFYLDVIHYECW